MLYTGLQLIILGMVIAQISGIISKRYIVRYNPDAKDYSAQEMKAEFRRVAGQNIVPKWVSMISIPGWILMGLGLLTVIWAMFTE